MDNCSISVVFFFLSEKYWQICDIDGILIISWIFLIALKKKKIK